MLLLNKVYTWSVTFSVCFGEGILEREPLSTIARPSFKWLHYSLFNVMFMVSSPSACQIIWMFLLGYHKAFGNILCSATAQVIMSIHCKLKSKEHSLHSLRLNVSNLCSLGKAKIHACAWRSPTPLHQYFLLLYFTCDHVKNKVFFHRPCFIFAGMEGQELYLVWHSKRWN